ncbi:MAG: hypothetical protein EBW47_10605 [Betaproteobacteria bacterium]|nr:hypothetical protein [Betaproteobacteria bacterium]
MAPVDFPAVSAGLAQLSGIFKEKVGPAHGAQSQDARTHFQGGDQLPAIPSDPHGLFPSAVSAQFPLGLHGADALGIACHQTCLMELSKRKTAGTK